MMDSGDYIGVAYNPTTALSQAVYPISSVGALCNCGAKANDSSS